MEWLIEDNFQNARNKLGYFTASIQGNDIVIVVNEMSQESSIIDTLSSFHTLQIPSTKPNTLTLIGISSARTFRFIKNEAIPNIWQLFQRVFILKPIPNEFRSFSIIPKHDKLNSNNSNVITENNDIIPVISLLKQKDLSYKKYIKISDIIQLNTEEEIQKFVDSKKYKVFNINSKILLKIWLKYLNISLTKDVINEYLSLKQQFSSFSSNLWNENPKFRELVYTIENKLEQSTLTVPLFKQISFNVILAFSFQHFDRETILQEIFDLVVFFIRKTCINQTKDGLSVILSSEENMNSDDFSALLFAILNKISTTQFWNISQSFHDSILEEIDAFSGHCGYEIRRIGFKNVSFMNAFLKSIFITGKKLDEQTLIFNSCLFNGFIEKFAAKIVASSISCMEDQFQNIPSNLPHFLEEMIKTNLTVFSPITVLTNIWNKQ